MTGPSPLQPDPSVLSGISKAPFALLPRPERLFRTRAERFERLAEGSRLEPYLRFLAGIARAQDALAGSAPAPDPIPPERAEQARNAAMPPLDRDALAQAPETMAVLRLFLEAARPIEKPEPAALALADLAETDDAALAPFLAETLTAAPRPKAAAHQLYVSAALQIVAARLAAPLDAARLVPVGTGLCPVCGGRPVASLVTGVSGAEGARYALCSLCQTQWNEVRVKCLSCGSTGGIGYRAVETDEATVKAEICDSCQSWVKILYQDRNPSLEGVADDVSSLGLDVLMRETAYRRAGLNPFLLGY